MNYHPDVALRTAHVQIHWCYDGSIVLQTFAEVVGRDGKSMEHRVGYGHRLAPNRWHGLTLAEACNEAIVEHHKALGLNPPPPDHILHLHPHGYPGTQHYAPVPEKPQIDTPPDLEERVKQEAHQAKMRELHPEG